MTSAGFFFIFQPRCAGSNVRLKKKELSGVVKSLSHIGSFGLTIGAAILIGYYTGTYIDGRLGTEPWFMLIFILLFMVGAFIKFINETKDVGKLKGKNEKVM